MTTYKTATTIRSPFFSKYSISLEFYDSETEFCQSSPKEFIRCKYSIAGIAQTVNS